MDWQRIETAPKGWQRVSMRDVDRKPPEWEAHRVVFEIPVRIRGAAPWGQAKRVLDCSRRDGMCANALGASMIRLSLFLLPYVPGD
jgi:hypothetical protein